MYQSRVASKIKYLLSRKKKKLKHGEKSESPSPSDDFVAENTDIPTISKKKKKKKSKEVEKGEIQYLPNESVTESAENKNIFITQQNCTKTNIRTLIIIPPSHK